MTDITQIPLSQLIAWEGNARRTMTEDGLSELESSIKAHGLLQSLVVKKEGDKFAVVAGNRRLAALQNLSAQGSGISDEYLVPCQIVDEQEAAAANLAENTVRESMHPADQFEAFRKLIDEGKSAIDVAAAFGVTETVVLQRMKLAQVSPVIIEAYRNEELNLEQVIGFAATDDHEAQERFFKSHGDVNANYIRRTLTENEIATDDERALFVGLKAYEKAGGTVKRDLFSEEGKGGFITDTELLAKLAQEKLEKIAAKLRKEGWKWVQIAQSFTYQDKAKFQQLQPEEAPLPDDLRKEYAKLEAERDKLQAKYDRDYEQDEDTDFPERLTKVEKRIEEIDDQREDVFTPEQLAITGAVVTIGDDGKAEIVRGLARPEDMPDKKGKSKAKAADDGEAEQEAEESSLPASLIEDLTAQKSAAITATLMKDPHLALRALVHAMACQIFGKWASTKTSLQISATQEYFGKVNDSKALDQITSIREKWEKKLPADQDDLWKWCLKAKQDTLLDLLAVCVALTVDCVQMKQNSPSDPRLVHADKLAAEMDLNMTDWFTPTAENYFSRVGKPQILEALQEIEATPPSNGMKKAELAKYAEQSVNGKAWLPKPLRTA